MCQSPLVYPQCDPAGRPGCSKPAQIRGWPPRPPGNGSTRRPGLFPLPAVSRDRYGRGCLPDSALMPPHRRRAPRLCARRQRGPPRCGNTNPGGREPAPPPCPAPPAAAVPPRHIPFQGPGHGRFGKACTGRMSRGALVPLPLSPVPPFPPEARNPPGRNASGPYPAGRARSRWRPRRQGVRAMPPGAPSP
ncbi:MAG: hypothetical protein BWX80_03605 [Candidatus Hydrogenedentes bacterium ADurb.Bin101]|nr:MAG: hypothetical protein BWX80_03605 [Candidatus Hydrogenedentes bacterium ADurb.Bin101]